MALGRYLFPPRAPVEPDKSKLDRLLGLVLELTQQGAKIMATLDDITAAVAAETAVEQSAVTLLGQIHGELVAAQASGDPARMQAIIDSIQASSTALAAAITANTPAATPPAAAPAP